MTPNLGIWDYPLVEKVTIVTLTTFIIGKLHAFYCIAMNFKLWTWFNTYYTLLNTIQNIYVNLWISYSIWLLKWWIVLYNFNVFSVLPLTCKELYLSFFVTLLWWTILKQSIKLKTVIHVVTYPKHPNPEMRIEDI